MPALAGLKSGTPHQSRGSHNLPAWVAEAGLALVDHGASCEGESSSAATINVKAAFHCMIEFGPIQYPRGVKLLPGLSLRQN